jgi:hypothetical protein
MVGEHRLPGADRPQLEQLAHAALGLGAPAERV